MSSFSSLAQSWLLTGGILESDLNVPAREDPPSEETQGEMSYMTHQCVFNLSLEQGGGKMSADECGFGHQNSDQSLTLQSRTCDCVC
jgi:hypothetical protein